MGYYYAYSLTPVKTQSIIQAANLVFQGAYPPALVTVFSQMLASAQPDNLNLGHLEYFYYVCLAFCAIGTPIFFVVNRACGELKNPNEGAEEERLQTSVIGGMGGMRSFTQDP